jgi:hypothetical protein
LICVTSLDNQLALHLPVTHPAKTAALEFILSRFVRIELNGGRLVWFELRATVLEGFQFESMLMIQGFEMDLDERTDWYLNDGRIVLILLATTSISLTGASAGGVPILITLPPLWSPCSLRPPGRGSTPESRPVSAFFSLQSPYLKVCDSHRPDNSPKVHHPC